MFVAPSARAGAPGVGAAWLAFAIVGTLPLFWFGLAGLADAWARPEFSHGPVIPVLSFYMFLREMKAVPPTAQPVTDRWPGVGVILFALALAALGNLVRIDHLVFYALIVWVAGLVLVSGAGCSGPRSCTSSSCCPCRSSSTGRSTRPCSSSPRRSG
jgi:hypothetical protein